MDAVGRAFVFVFQAEDGIRDIGVTGVQTCALPISEEQIVEECPWATMGRVGGRTPNILTSLELKSEVMEQRNLALQRKYQQIKENEVRYETQQMDDADYVIVAFGSAARIAEKGVELARKKGLRVGLFRPITLWPFPEKQIAELSKGKKGVLVVEINAEIGRAHV